MEEATALNNAVPSSVSYVIGCLMIIVFGLGLLENGLVFFVYSRSKKVRKSKMAFVVGLSLSDMGQTVLNIPFVIISSFSRRWMFGHSGCVYVGFVTTLFGIVQISFLCIIAMERYFIIVRQSRKFSASTFRTKATVACCFIYGACWALGPVLGWSEYKLVAGEISCSINWTVKNIVYLSYTMALFSAVWFLPLSLITFAYTRIAIFMYTQRNKRQSLTRERKTRREKRVTITLLLMIGAFVLSWTPYSVMALISTFGDINNAPSGLYLVPAAFAKASIIWNPIIYTVRHVEFRRACMKSFRKKFSNDISSSMSSSQEGRNRKILTSGNETAEPFSKIREALPMKVSILGRNSEGLISGSRNTSVSNITDDSPIVLQKTNSSREVVKECCPRTFSIIDRDLSHLKETIC